mmetsp:Transcript_15492/g.15693  ORF Transcript_15492/g.15693 Transcript_15492/m.15693 type:complete len:393 (-) Transcript_15492:190-1368(-)|eukprot:CAMPEP_0171299788 /NCGR_PEP_ID=MMETSP0816-20121228/8661_1 /TAXON_ID=420281 /ORGANISM="Proboscia inermis, Strain CCAP1064/1" /LENGTH=392 /DNA_ID=CAMNT_0011775889 /DNA_START=132 /DNA_END=1310 /DNA_ORIENTATION=-
MPIGMLRPPRPKNVLPRSTSEVSENKETHGSQETTLPSNKIINGPKEKEENHKRCSEGTSGTTTTAISEPASIISPSENSSFAEAQFQEGWDYLMGDNFRMIDRDRGKDLIQKAMSEGCIVAHGFCLFRGWGGVKKDFGEAFKIFCLATDSEGEVGSNNRSTALALKGYLCRKGCGSNPNVKDAVKYLTEAAESHHAWAMAMLAFWFQEDKELCSNDDEAAFQLYKSSAELGYSKSMYNLAELYQTGVGVSKNQSEGKRWLQKAADLKYAPAKEKLEADTSDKGKKKKPQFLRRRSSESGVDESSKRNNKNNDDNQGDRKNTTKEKKSKSLFKKMGIRGSSRSVSSKSIFSSWSHSRVASSKASESYGVINNRKKLGVPSSGNSVVSDITDN